MPRKWIAGAIGMLAIAAVSIALLRHNRAHETPASAPPAPVLSEVVLNARIEPRNVVQVGAPIEGTLDAFFVEPGQAVYKDQLLGRIRDPNAENAVQQAQVDLDRAQARVAELNSEQLAARLELSRAEAEQSRARGELERLQTQYERQKGLWDAGAIARLTFEKSQKDYNDAKTALQKADAAAKDAAERAAAIEHEIATSGDVIAAKTAALDRARAALNAGELHSPADGIVVAHHGQPGDTVDPSMKHLVEVATDLNSLQAVAAADASILPRIHASQAATVRFESEEDAGVVLEVRGRDVIVQFNSAAPITRLDLTAQVKIKF